MSDAADDPAATWVFGYGSIINNESRALSTSDAGACFARLKAASGYVREWSFRSSTGFTALGVRQVVAPSEARPVAGVLVAVDSTDGIAALDQREKGYTYVCSVSYPSPNHNPSYSLCYQHAQLRQPPSRFLLSWGRGCGFHATQPRTPRCTAAGGRRRRSGE